MTDELRDRLSRLDPMQPGVPVDAVTSPSSQELMEVVMSTRVEEKSRPSQGGRGRWLAVAAAAAVVIGVGGVLTLGGGAPTTLTLNAGGEDPMAMCIQFSIEQLAEAPVAFEGTVTAVDGSVVTLDVDTWFKGGDADQVVLNAPQGMEALIGGMQFTVGDPYLISAYDGNVNYCGFSGPATADLRAAFEAAFGA